MQLLHRYTPTGQTSVLQYGGLEDGSDPPALGNSGCVHSFFQVLWFKMALMCQSLMKQSHPLKRQRRTMQEELLAKFVDRYLDKIG